MNHSLASIRSVILEEIRQLAGKKAAQKAA